MKQQSELDRRRHRPAGQRRRDLVNVDGNSAPRARRHRAATIDNALYDAFGQRQVATIYDELNQYHVVMEWAPRLHARPERAVRCLRAGDADACSATTATARRPSSRTASDGHDRPAPRHLPVSANPALQQRLRRATCSATARPASMVPLSAIGASSANAPRRPSVNHQDAELATTISFNLGRRREPQRRARTRSRAGRGRHRHAHQRARQLRRARR